jgi:hypothetical protein
MLEDIEICSVNVELVNRTESFDDPAWIERRSLAARTRLEATTDPVLLPGYRKLVRKWNEELMRFQTMVRVKSRMACEAGGIFRGRLHTSRGSRKARARSDGQGCHAAR